jgi:magnesium chelatase family protein
VLFLDELGEFPLAVLDALRQPLEEGVVRIARADHRVTVPSRFLLLGAMNPCPCGEGMGPAGCRCSDRGLERYRRRVSGPLLDRFDLRVDILRPEPGQLLHGDPGDPSAVVAGRVRAARVLAAERGVDVNAALSVRELGAFAPLSPDASRLLEKTLADGRLSARGLQRVWRVALTVADLAGDEPPLTAEHVATALHLRSEPSFLLRRRAS